MHPFAVSLLPLLLMSNAVSAAPLPSSAPIDPQIAPSMFVEALRYGTAPTHALRQHWRQIDDTGRIALVESAYRWARAFATSELFTGSYQGLRELARPVEPVAADSIHDPAAQQKAADEMIAAMRAGLEQVPPDQREELEKAIRDAEESMRAVREDAELQAMQAQFAEADLEQARQQHRQDLQRWEHDMPADPGRLIARRLRQFIDTCSAVEFDAELDASSGLRRFADPAHEAQGWEWKLCFRAGAAPVERALALAQEWLVVLPDAG